MSSPAACDSLTVGVTGHRFLAEIERIEQGLGSALAAIERAWPDRGLRLLSPLAEGADRVVAQVLLRRGHARLLAALPLAADEYLKDFDTAESKREFEELIAQAEDLVELPAASSRGRAYDAVGSYVVAHCDVLIAVWDGSVDSGTGKVVAEARSKGVPVAWVHAGNRKPGSTEPTSLGDEQGRLTLERFPAGSVASGELAVGDHPPKPRLVVHVGATGHRGDDLEGCDIASLRQAVAGALGRVKELAARVAREHGGVFRTEPPILRLFSRLADGSDLLVATEAVKQGFELNCPLPFAPEIYERYIAPQWREEYRALLAAAPRLLILDGDPDRLNESFFESRRMVLRHSDLLIAIWDPERCPSGVWGTTRLVDEARHDDLLILHIPPSQPASEHLDSYEQAPEVHSLDSAQLEARLLALLAPPSGAEAGGEAPGHLDFFAERRWKWAPGFVWPLFRDLWHKGELRRPRLDAGDPLGETLRQWKRRRERNAAAGGVASERIDELLAPAFAWADRLADRYADLTRSLIVANYLMAASAVFLALIGHGFGTVFLVGELALIVTIIAATSAANRRHWHRRWIDYRLLAERLRLHSILAPLGRSIPDTRRPAHLGFGDVRGSWIFWYFRAFARELGMVGERYDSAYVEACRAAVLDLVSTPGSGQADWHRANAHRFEIIERRLERSGMWLFGLTGLSCVAHIFWHASWLTLFAAGLPALGAALAAIAVNLQLDRIAKHSECMAGRLDDLCAYLRRCAARSLELGRPLEEIAECMTSEVLDWRTLFRGRIAPPS